MFQHLHICGQTLTCHWPARFLSAFIGRAHRVDPSLSQMGYEIGNRGLGNLDDSGAGGAPLADLKHDVADREARRTLEIIAQ